MTLTGNLLWFPEHLFSTHLPKYFSSTAALDRKLPAAVVQARRNFVQGKARTMRQDVRTYQKQVP